MHHGKQLLWRKGKFWVRNIFFLLPLMLLPKRSIVCWNLKFCNAVVKPHDDVVISANLLYSCLLFCSPLGSQKCYKCNRVGHLARDCQEQEERCYRCNDIGHKSRDCKFLNLLILALFWHTWMFFVGDREKDQLGCYNCKEKGHLVRDCPTKVDVCFACNLEGHISRKSLPRLSIAIINYDNHSIRSSHR